MHSDERAEETTIALALLCKIAVVSLLCSECVTIGLSDIARAYVIEPNLPMRCAAGATVASERRWGADLGCWAGRVGRAAGKSGLRASIGSARTAVFSYSSPVERRLLLRCSILCYGTACRGSAQRVLGVRLHP